MRNSPHKGHRLFSRDNLVLRYYPHRGRSSADNQPGGIRCCSGDNGQAQDGALYPLGRQGSLSAFRQGVLRIMRQQLLRKPNARRQK